MRAVLHTCARKFAIGLVLLHRSVIGEFMLPQTFALCCSKVAQWFHSIESLPEGGPVYAVRYVAGKTSWHWYLSHSVIPHIPALHSLLNVIY